jgi:predicted RNA-binding Zn ribbon-like protein
MTDALNEIQGREERGDSFPFLGGSLALDLLNTEAVLRNKKYELLPSSEELACWWREALVHHPEHARVEGDEHEICWTMELLDEVKRARQELRSLYTHLTERQTVLEGDLEALNQMLALGYQSLRQDGSGKIVTIYRTHAQPLGRILLPIALSACQLLTESERPRLHKCKNERCILFFYDTTRSGTRRWCSLSCMNRDRSLRHYHAR